MNQDNNQFNPLEDYDFMLLVKSHETTIERLVKVKMDAKNSLETLSKEYKEKGKIPVSLRQNIKLSYPSTSISNACERRIRELNNHVEKEFVNILCDCREQQFKDLEKDIEQAIKIGMDDVESTLQSAVLTSTNIPNILTTLKSRFSHLIIETENKIRLKRALQLKHSEKAKEIKDREEQKMYDAPISMQLGDIVEHKMKPYVQMVKQLQKEQQMEFRRKPSKTVPSTRKDIAGNRKMIEQSQPW